MSTPARQPSYCKVPLCEQHQPGTMQPTPSEVPDWLEKKVQLMIAENERLLDFHAHHSSENITDLSELGDKALLKGYGARECAQHGVIHVYRLEHARASFSVPKKILQDVGYTDRKLKRALRAWIAAQDCLFNHGQYTEDKAFMRSLQEEYRERISDPVEFVPKVKKKKVRNTASKLKHKPVIQKQRADPKIDPNDVPDELILEFGKCGRKIAYETEEQGLVAVKNLNRNQKELLVLYPCEYCKKYHAGHGDGNSPIQDRLQLARKWWRVRPHKANAFAARKGLLVE
jgi:hypothetical protein